MKVKAIKNIERILIVFLTIIICLGIIKNYKMIAELKNIQSEVLISEEEKEYIKTVLYDTKRNGKVLEKEYLEVLNELENKEPYQGLEEEIARVYYFLGYNDYLDAEYKSAEEYLEKAINIFDKEKNYFYILNGNNVLINIAYEKKDYITAVNRASKTYKVLQNPNIEGISKKGQEQLKANILTGLVNVTAGIGMDSIASSYYSELVEITEDPFFENNLTLYAKYYYNLMYKNYDDAKEYAIKYIEYIRKIANDDEKIANSAHIYLLRVLARAGTEEEFRDAYLKVENGYEELDKDSVNGSLKEIEAEYYKASEDYQKAYQKYEEAIVSFEKTGEVNRVYDICLEIINLNSKVKVNIDKYVNKIDECDKTYNKEVIVGELADAITKTSYEKNKEDKYMLITEAESKEELIQHSKNINFIYMVIIFVLIVMARKLKNEIFTREAKEKELEDMINEDYLTKAASKQYIFEKINNYIEKKNKFKLIIFDLDNFKKINDEYGHNFGDEVLIKIVENIRETIADNGIIGRFGGEEFIIVVEKDVCLETLTNEIRMNLQKIKYSIDNLNVTVSGGAIEWTNETVDDLIYSADVLLYEAKANGKDKILIKQNEN
ncbi:MAG: diguanylate cyclase domain-containing protein [Sarcina sp.]